MTSCNSGKFSPAPRKKMCPYAYVVSYTLKISGTRKVSTYTGYTWKYAIFSRALAYSQNQQTSIHGKYSRLMKLFIVTIFIFFTSLFIVTLWGKILGIRVPSTANHGAISRIAISAGSRYRAWFWLKSAKVCQLKNVKCAQKHDPFMWCSYRSLLYWVVYIL